MCQVLCGAPFVNQMAYFQIAGLSSLDAFKMGFGTTAMGFVGTCGSWVTMTASYLVSSPSSC
jgi:hypothetical protein